MCHSVHASSTFGCSRKAPSGISCQRTGQYWTTQSLFNKAVRLGEKIRIERENARFVGGLAKGARAGVGKGCGRKRHPRASTSGLGEPCQRSLDVAITEINGKTDLKIGLQSLKRAKHRRVTAVTFVIEASCAQKRVTETVSALCHPRTLA
jgi:hypothetical protein